jgi:NAD+ diphosphatase
MAAQGFLAFSGSGLDRMAHLRGTSDARPKAQDVSIVLWRGKILVDLAADHAVIRMDVHHPTLVGQPVIFLGADDHTRVFATDLSSWEPEAGNDPDKTLFFDPTQQRHPDFPENYVFVELRSILIHMTARDAELAATAKALLEWHRSHAFCAKCGGPSDMVQSGWQRSCPACGEQHFPRTDPVVIMLITHGRDILLGRSPQWPDAMYSCLAGFVEPGETIESAVRREVFEETQIKVGDVRYITSQPWPFPNSLMFGCHGVATSRDIEIDPTEIEDAKWVSRAQMMDVFSGHDASLMPARPGSIAHYLIRSWMADAL